MIYDLFAKKLDLLSYKMALPVLPPCNPAQLRVLRKQNPSFLKICLKEHLPP